MCKAEKLIIRLVEESVADIKEYKDLGFEDGESELDNAYEKNRWLVEVLYGFQKAKKIEADMRRLKRALKNENIEK